MDKEYAMKLYKPDKQFKKNKNEFIAYRLPH